MIVDVDSKTRGQRISRGKRQAFRERVAQENPDDAPKLKKCNGCKKWKPFFQFTATKRKLKSGITREYLASKCKDCRKTQAADWKAKQKAKDPQEWDRRQKRYNENRNQEKQRRAKRERYATKRLEAGKSYTPRNPPASLRPTRT